jgi:hypothetical protein
VAALTKYQVAAGCRGHAWRKQEQQREAAAGDGAVTPISQEQRQVSGEQGPQFFPVHVKQESCWQEDEHDGRFDRAETNQAVDVAM